MVQRSSAARRAAARRTLREQIARLEREHAIVHRRLPRLEPGPPAPRLAGPRLLPLGELERVRDDLAARTGDLELARPSRPPAGPRRELERMLADPAHRWRKLTNADLGLPGCGPTTSARAPASSAC